MPSALLITIGRTMLSTQLTSSTHQISSPRPCETSPVATIHATMPPHTNGTAKGISAATVVTAAANTGARTPKIA
jgi:hypothetical protein